MNRNILINVIFFLNVLFYISFAHAQVDNAPSVFVKTAKIERRFLGETIDTFGILDPDPDQIISLSLPKAGLINRVWVRSGQRVKRGDNLIEIITSPESHMQFLQAQSAVNFKERELDRRKSLLAVQLATKAMVDTAAIDLEDAKSTLEALKLKGMDSNEEIIVAPRDGIITQLTVSQGQRVSADTTTLLIATEKNIVARLGLEPEDLGKIQLGLSVSVSSVFVPDVKIESTIREVHAMIDPKTNLVEILVPIPSNQTNKTILGSRIIGQVHLPEHEALVVPRSAVLMDKKAVSYLFTVQNGKAKYTEVQLGIEVGDFIEVIGNINVNDIVVVTGNYELKDNMAIRENP